MEWQAVCCGATAMEYDRYPEEVPEMHAARLRGLLEQRDNEIAELRARLANVDDQNINMAGDKLARSADGNGSAVLTSVGGGAGAAADGLEDAEAILAERSQAAQNPAVLQLLQTLQTAAVYTDTPNHETNRKLWDAYAKDWSPEQDWVQRMAGHLPGEPREISCIGDEWSDATSLTAILDDWVFSQVWPTARIAEIGSGGGRVAAHVAPRVQELFCFDISQEMLGAAKKYLSSKDLGNVQFQHLAPNTNGAYPKKYDGSFDFVYSFDVFVHMDLHEMRQTLCSIRALLKPGGGCFVSFANLLAPDGWRRFSRQAKYTVGGFYFISPDIACQLLRKAGLEICRISSPRADNLYLSRDLLVLAKRPA